jgi:hypothetical protein
MRIYPLTLRGRMPLHVVLMTALCSISFSALNFTPAFAQEVTGTIVGTVTDPTGAAIPNATITVTNTDRSTVIRTLTAGGQGEFRASLLPVGTYSVTIDAPGFKARTETGIRVNVSDQHTVKAVLELGQTSETVNVEASALQVDTQSATAQGLVTGTQIRELALQNRNYEELVSLMPGVSADIGDQLFVGVTKPDGTTNESAFSMNGSYGTGNNWTVDGADNVDRGGNYTLLDYPSVDAIDEFKVLRGNYNAEYGRSAGGQVNVITRSGTSRFHGSAYEFFRNDVLNANTWANKNVSPVLPRTPLRYNDFGWTIGGPLFIPTIYNTDKKKTFFFYSEELRRIIQYSPSAGVSPTASERAGTFASPVCTVSPAIDSLGNVYCPAPGVITQNIASSSFNPAAVAYLKDIYSHVPVPQDPTTDILNSNQSNVFNYRQEIIRGDHTFNSKLSGFVRWINDSIPTIQGGGLFNGNPLPNVATTATNSPGKNIAASLTMTFTPTLLNELEYAWSYGGVISNNTGLLAQQNSPDITSAISLPSPVTVGRIPNVSFGVGSASFAGFGNYGDYNKNHLVFDNLTKTLGRHNLKFGFAYNHYEKSENAAGNNSGTFSFSATPLASSANVPLEFEQEFALFLTGQATSFTQSPVDIRAVVFQNELEFYGQDSFRLFPNLTLSYGLRYSLFRQPTNGRGQATSFDPTRFNAANVPVIDNSGNLCTPGILALQPCDGTIATNPTYDPLNGVIIGGNKNGAHNSPFGTAVARQVYSGVQPRVGIAWDPSGQGKTSVRGGYGLFTESPGIGFVENNTFINPPFVGSITINNAPFTNPNGGSLAPNNTPPGVGGTAANWHQPYAQQWNIDLQHQVKYDILVDIGYYGSKGTHLLADVDINEPVPGAYATNPLIQNNPNYGGGQITAGEESLLNLIRPYQGYGAIDIYSPIFSANYNSLQASAQKHFSAESLIGINYTWSKNLSSVPDSVGGNQPAPQNTYNLAAEYGPARFDRRNVFNANFVYQLPFFKQQNSLAAHTLGGWEFSGIIEAQSGQWLNAVGNQSVDPGGVGVFTSAYAPKEVFPDQVGNPQSHAPHTAAQWYNTSAFTDVPFNEARPGNARRSTILGPGSSRWDLTFMKNTKIKEDVNLQFRAESFNTWNHTNLGAPDTTQSDGTTGQIFGAGENRQLQLALKLSF